MTKCKRGQTEVIGGPLPKKEAQKLLRWWQTYGPEAGSYRIERAGHAKFWQVAGPCHTRRMPHRGRRDWVPKM